MTFFTWLRLPRLARKWWVMFGVMLGMFMTMLDGTVVTVAVPHLQAAFGVDIQSIQWIVTVYMLTQAAVIPAAPYLIARFGGRQTYIWTLLAFLAGSVLCGFAWDLPSLVAFRFVQGIGGGILLPVVMTLVYQEFAPAERGLAVSIMGIPLMIAPTLGPLLGGFLLTGLGWPAIFFVNIPIGILSIAIARRVLSHAGREAAPRFDLAGFLSVAGGCAALLYGVAAVAGGDGAVPGWPILAAAVALLLAFVAIERRKAGTGRAPLLDLHQFGDRTFTLSNLANICVGCARFGTLFVLPIYLQTLRQQTAVATGEFLMLQALATLALLPLVGKLAQRTGPRPLVLAGLVGFAVAAGLMTTQTLSTSLWFLAAILVVQGSAFALLQQTPVAAMSRIEKEQQKDVAHGSTLVTVLHSTAAPLGVALFSGVMQSRGAFYSAALARQGLTGALAQQQGALLGMQDSFRIAVLLMALAVVAMVFVPGRRARPATQPQIALDSEMGA